MAEEEKKWTPLEKETIAFRDAINVFVRQCEKSIKAMPRKKKKIARKYLDRFLNTRII